MHIRENLTSTFRRRRIVFVQKQSTPTIHSKATSINRWELYKQLCVAKSVFGVNDRCLAVLSSLLSFYPENEISAKTGLVVFPSNRQLSLRAHGMPESTLRRHLGSLIDAGLITRRDSPNGKRYAYKTETGKVEEAFGFSFLPLLARAQEIAEAAEKIQAQAKLLKRTREQITLQRRDLAQLFETMPVEMDATFWAHAYQQFRAIVDGIPRRGSMSDLSAILEQLTALQGHLSNHMISLKEVTEMNGNHAQNERHQYESHSESLYIEENELFVDLKDTAYTLAQNNLRKKKALISSQHSILSLETVLRTCPDIRDYASGHVASWRDLIDASRIVAKFLGIAQTAYQDATAYMGQENASAIIAWLLQRSSRIRSVGGYLRYLTQQARLGSLSVQHLLLSDPNQNKSGFS